MAALAWWHHFTLYQMQIECIIRQRWLYNVHERQENASDFWQYFCIFKCIFICICISSGQIFVFAFAFRAGGVHRQDEVGKFLRHCAMTVLPMHLIINFTPLCNALQCSEMQSNVYNCSESEHFSTEQNSACSWRGQSGMGVKIFGALHPLLHYSSQHFFSSTRLPENILNFQSLLSFQLFACSNVSFGGKSLKTGDPNVLASVRCSELLQAKKFPARQKLKGTKTKTG